MHAQLHFTMGNKIVSKKECYDWRTRESTTVYTVEYANGLSYVGGLDDKKQRCGHGVLYNAHGNVVYDGEWINDQRDGYGTELDHEGRAVYVGCWLKNKRHGLGTGYWILNDNMYHGEWEGGVPKGRGTYYFKVHTYKRATEKCFYAVEPVPKLPLAEKQKVNHLHDLYQYVHGHWQGRRCVYWRKVQWKTMPKPEGGARHRRSRSLSERPPTDLIFARTVWSVDSCWKETAHRRRNSDPMPLRRYKFACSSRR